MRLSYLTLLGAIAATLSSTRAADGGFIISTQPTNPGAFSQTRQAGNFSGAITTAVNVGSSNVTINSFGTFGQMLGAGSLKFLIFQNVPNSAPVYSSALIPTSAGSGLQWHDAPTLSFTLLANTSYRIGVLADQGFTYTYDFPGTAVSGGGLTTPASQNGNTDSNFAAPTNQGGGTVLNSFRAFQNDGLAVATPLPPTLLAGVGMAALLGLRRLRGRRA